MARRRRYSAEFKREAVAMTRVPRPVQYSCADGRFGSQADHLADITSTAASEGKAVIQRPRLDREILNVCFSR